MSSGCIERGPDTGFLYIITNPAWQGWCKIGLTRTNIESRLMSYQTASPFRDYEVYATKKVNKVGKAEKQLHKILEAAGYTKQNEWFKISPSTALELLSAL